MTTADKLYHRVIKNKLLHIDIRGIVKDYNRDPNSVKQIAIPALIDDDNRLFVHEFGGLNRKGWGVALIIGNPSAEMADPISFKKVNPKPNGRQGAANVWEGCFIGVGNSNKGKRISLLYRVTELVTIDTYNLDPEKFSKSGAVSMKLVGVSTSTFGNVGVDICAPIDDIAQSATEMLFAIDKKLKDIQCTRTYYLDPWYMTSRSAKSHTVLFKNSDLTEEEILTNYKIESADSFRTLVEMTENHCHQLVTVNYIPVRMKVFDTKDSDVKKVYILILDEPEFIDVGNGNKRINPEQELGINHIMATEITSKMDFSNKGEGIYLDANTYDKFIKKCKNGDIWFIYRGC